MVDTATIPDMTKANPLTGTEMIECVQDVEGVLKTLRLDPNMILAFLKASGIAENWTPQAGVSSMVPDTLITTGPGTGSTITDIADGKRITTGPNGAVYAYTTPGVFVPGATDTAFYFRPQSPAPFYALFCDGDPFGISPLSVAIAIIVAYHGPDDWLLNIMDVINDTATETPISLTDAEVIGQTFAASLSVSGEDYTFSVYRGTDPQAGAALQWVRNITTHGLPLNNIDRFAAYTGGSEGVYHDVISTPAVAFNNLEQAMVSSGISMEPADIPATPAKRPFIINGLAAPVVHNGITYRNGMVVWFNENNELIPYTQLLADLDADISAQFNFLVKPTLNGDPLLTNEEPFTPISVASAPSTIMQIGGRYKDISTDGDTVTDNDAYLPAITATMDGAVVEYISGKEDQRLTIRSNGSDSIYDFATQEAISSSYTYTPNKAVKILFVADYTNLRWDAFVIADANQEWLLLEHTNPNNASRTLQADDQLVVRMTSGASYAYSFNIPQDAQPGYFAKVYSHPDTVAAGSQVKVVAGGVLGNIYRMTDTGSGTSFAFVDTAATETQAGADEILCVFYDGTKVYAWPERGIRQEVLFSGGGILTSGDTPANARWQQLSGTGSIAFDTGSNTFCVLYGGDLLDAAGMSLYSGNTSKFWNINGESTSLYTFKIYPWQVAICTVTTVGASAIILGAYGASALSKIDTEANAGNSINPNFGEFHDLSNAEAYGGSNVFQVQLPAYTFNAPRNKITILFKPNAAYNKTRALQFTPYTGQNIMGQADNASYQVGGEYSQAYLVEAEFSGDLDVGWLIKKYSAT